MTSQRQKRPLLVIREGGLSLFGSHGKGTGPRVSHCVAMQECLTPVEVKNFQSQKNFQLFFQNGFSKRVLLPLHLVFAPLASGPSPSSVGTPGSGNAIKPFIARQYYITGGSVAVAAEGCFARCCFQWHLRFNHVAFKSRLPCVASSIACNVFFFFSYV